MLFGFPVQAKEHSVIDPQDLIRSGDYIWSLKLFVFNYLYLIDGFIYDSFSQGKATGIFLNMVKIHEN